MKQRTNRSGKTFLAPLFLLLILPLALAISDAEHHYGFENFPGTTATDDGSGNIILDMSTGDLATTSAKVGNWAVEGDGDDEELNASGYDTSNPGYLKSFSLWTKPAYTGTSTTYDLFSYGTNSVIVQQGAHARVIDDGRLEIVLGKQTGGCVATNANIWETDDEPLTIGSWNHVVIAITQNDPSPQITVYVNNQEQNITKTQGTLVNYQFGGLTKLLNATTDCFTGTRSSVAIDEFTVYNYTINAANVTTLYNSGYGFNPYSTDLPEQIASINTIDLDTYETEERNMSDYFLNDQYFQLNFTYDSTSYFANETQSVNTGDFAIQFIDADTIRFYSYGNFVIQTPMTLEACNVNGCIEATIYFQVQGFGIPSQIASVADWDIPEGVKQYRTFSDYFSTYTRRFLQYISPDDNVTLINVSSTTSDENRLFTAEIIGDRIYITGNNSGQVQARMIVDDEVTGVNGNYFTITIQQVSESAGYINRATGFFPDADDLSTGSKILYVLITMFVLIGAGILLSKESTNPSTIVPAVTGAGIVLTIVFYTAIGYIPIWVVVLIGLLIVILSVGYFKQRTVGVA